MATVWMMSFDWGGFEAMLAPPATGLASRVARRIGTTPRRPAHFSGLPETEPELASRLAGLLADEDWYAGKAVDECRMMDRLVDLVFIDLKPKELRRKPLSDGVDVYALELANGRLEVDPDRAEGGDRQLRPSPPGPPRGDLVELPALGNRPHRHPAWDREAADALLKANNPFLPGSTPVYCPGYSIHSPEQVDRLLEELIGVRDRIREAPAEIRANFDEWLFGPIAKASKAGLAVFARADY